ncbi:MAG: tetratricopeptide repeat protein [Phycisphaerae bacterium]|nr:tetratricopeptide repeat protein [Phycisphaerae bacterium]
MPEAIHRARDAFVRALAVAPEARPALLEVLCGDDPALLDEVRALLESHDTAGAFLEPDSSMDAAARRSALVWSGLPAGARLGRYTIREVLGTGGMGVVYLAEQESPRRTVALKVIRPGLASPAMLRRFEHEAAVLGRLAHPGIAQIFEAGTVEAGPASGGGTLPFFAMELVQGRTLLEHANAARLNTRQRLELMARVCDAVHHAHQKGVIHRDLKPGNILVQVAPPGDSAASRTAPANDAIGQPKVLDFGVARLTDADLAASTMHTGVGQLVGTLPYMSPEQVAGDPGALDTRSDVYALGVILFELLSGRTPHDLSKVSVPEAVRVIKEEEPTRLSSIDRLLRGDVETLVRKALERDKARRYQSAAEMAEDLRRFLRDEPLVARPPSRTYQLRKFAKRNRALVGGMAAVVAVLALGVAGTGVALARALRAEEISRQESQSAKKNAARADSVKQFLADMLGGIDPAVAQRMDRTLLTSILETAAAKVDGATLDPQAEGEVRHAIGISAYKAGLYPLAEPHLVRASALLDQAVGPDDPLSLDAANSLGVIRLHTNKLDEAETLFRRALAGWTRARGERDPKTMSAINDLAVALHKQHRLDESAELHRKALALKRDVLGRDHPDTLQSLSGLGQVLMDTGRLDEARPLLEEAYEKRKAIQGPDHPQTIGSLNNLAALHDRSNRRDLALPLYAEAYQSSLRVSGEAHPDTLTTMNNLAGTMVDLGQFDGAEAMYLKILEVQPRVLGRGHPSTVITANNLAKMYQKQRAFDKALPYFERAAEGARQAFPPGHLFTAAMTNSLGSTLTSLGRYADAEPRLLEARAMLEAWTSDDRGVRDDNVRTLVRLYEAWNKPDEAARWKALQASPKP